MFGVFQELLAMFRLVAWMVVLVIGFCGCGTTENNVLGTFELDGDVGCTNCALSGPERMTFDDNPSEQGSRVYRFDFGDGGFHSGHYELIYFDSSVQLLLHPEESSFEYLDLVGTTLQTDYQVGQSAIRRPCNGLLRCVWRRVD